MTDAAPNTDLYTRDGHISELTYDRLELGELSAEETQAVEAHASSCARCEESLQSLRSFDAQVSIAPPVSPPVSPPVAVPTPARRTPAVPAAPRRRGRSGGRAQTLWITGVAALTAAAAVALFVLPAQPTLPEDDGIRRKGATMDLTVVVDREDGPQSLVPGDAVYPGERLGFRVHVREAGHIMIVGVDEEGEPYLCYPQDGGGASRATQAMTRAQDLSDAVALDEVLGEETLLLLRCGEPFTFAAIQGDLPRVPAGCQREEVRVVKTRR